MPPIASEIGVRLSYTPGYFGYRLEGPELRFGALGFFTTPYVLNSRQRRLLYRLRYTMIFWGHGYRHGCPTNAAGDVRR